MTEPNSTPPSEAGRWRTVQPWVSLAVRLGVAGVLLAAAIPKLADQRQSKIAVGAYQVLPLGLVGPVGILLPIAELVLALLLVAGLLTRYAAIGFAILLVVFLAGIAQAWARGLSISCGCFGGGGDLPPGDKAPYLIEIGRDAAFLAGCAFLAVFPRSAFSADRALLLEPSERTSRP
jgi:uncharacterized membrane protein YphA (DoxX/SURF4 family)